MKPTYNELIEQYQEALSKANIIRSILESTSDGFKYLTCTRYYGSITWQSHENDFCANEEVSEYCGDNGIVDLYTNNPNHGIQNYSGGDTKIISEEDMKNMSKEDISMSKAICNWIIKS